MTYDASAATHRRVCEPVMHIHSDRISLISRKHWSRKHPIDKGSAAFEPIGSDGGSSDGPMFCNMTTIRQGDNRKDQKSSLWKHNHIGNVRKAEKSEEIRALYEK